MRLILLSVIMSVYRLSVTNLDFYSFAPEISTKFCSFLPMQFDQQNLEEAEFPENEYQRMDAALSTQYHSSNYSPLSSEPERRRKTKNSQAGNRA